MSSLIFTKKDILFTDNIDSFVDELKKGKFIIGADMPKGTIESMILENVFKLDEDTLKIYKIHSVKDKRNYELEFDTSVSFYGNGVEDIMLFYIQVMILNRYDVFFIDNYGNVDKRPEFIKSIEGYKKINFKA